MTDQINRIVNLHQKNVQYIRDIINAEELMDSKEAIDAAAR